MADTARGAAIAAEALEWIDTPFVWQQSVKGRQGGCDCRGLVSGVARECGFPEAASIYATMAAYSPKRPVPSALLKQGLGDVLEPVPFDRAALNGWIWAKPPDPLFDHLPEEFTPGVVLLGRIGCNPCHLGIHVGGRVVHARFEPSDRVRDGSLRAWLKVYPLDAIYGWRPLEGSN